MGASSYSGKGSTSSSRKYNKQKSESPMLEMLELLKEVERCREVVASRQADLDSAKKDLAKAEQRVSAQINKLDPETKTRFRRMMGGLAENDRDR